MSSIRITKKEWERRNAEEAPGWWLEYTHVAVTDEDGQPRFSYSTPVDCQFVDDMTLDCFKDAGLLSITGDEDTWTVHGLKEITVKRMADKEPDEDIVNRAIEKAVTEPKGFELTVDQKLKLRRWKSQVKHETGKELHLTYSFTETGVGTHVKVKDSVSGLELDVSEYDKW